MPSPLVLRIRPEVSLTAGPDGRMSLRAPWGAAGLGVPVPGFAAALRTLAGAGATVDRLADEVLSAGGSGELAGFYYTLTRLQEQAFLSYTYADADGALLTLIPVTRGFSPEPAPVEAGARYRLARFGYIRQEGDTLTLASPVAPARALLDRRVAAALVGALLDATPVADLSLAGLPSDTGREVISLLAHARLIEPLDADGTALDIEPALRGWEFQDLLIHQRSRTMRHGDPFGGVFPFAGQEPPLPAVKPAPVGERIALRRPSPEQLARWDPPFSEVLERRASHRAFGEPPITMEQLGEFLFRCARVRALTPADRLDAHGYETSSRPYPSGGAAHEIEIYPAVQRCTGLEPGLYHYDPLAHALVPVGADPAKVAELFRDAARAAPLETPPQTLLVLAARFGRVSWKYRSMAYALTLKHVGVLYQTMYLVATAMGLAPCALGAGDAGVFAAASGLDPLLEPSVGEFLLGSMAVPS